MNPRKPLGVLALAALAGALAFPLMQSSDAAVAPAPERFKRVVTAEAKATDSSRALRFSGVVRAKRDANLSFIVPGRVIKRWVEVGDRVDAGSDIAALDRRGTSNRMARAEAGVRQAREQLAQGRRDRKRTGRLAAQKAASEVELESASHAVSLYTASEDAALVELDEAKRMHRDGMLRAPFSGTIVRVDAEPGEFVGAGQSVATLSGEALEIEVQVPETVLSDIATDDTVDLALPMQGGRELRGRVTSIGHGGQGAGRLFPVVIALPEGTALVPGMTAELVLARADDDGVTIPVSSVVDAGAGETTVFVIEDGLAQRRPVQVVGLVGSRALIISGLEAGEDVISGGHFGLVPGQSVQVNR